jgi:hypothetical protein
MKKMVLLLFAAGILGGCHKDDRGTDCPAPVSCNMPKVYDGNAAKVTITNGVWGTIANMEGTCMPVIDPANTTCKTCPVKRTVKIHQYTTASNATASNGSTIFFDSFNTPLVAQVDTDVNGFFQVTLPPGQYSLAIVENGKLYANTRDAQNGLNPFTLTGGAQKVNVTMTYKAVF